MCQTYVVLDLYDEAYIKEVTHTTYHADREMIHSFLRIYVENTSSNVIRRLIEIPNVFSLFLFFPLSDEASSETCLYEMFLYQAVLTHPDL